MFNGSQIELQWERKPTRKISSFFQKFCWFLSFYKTMLTQILFQKSFSVISTMKVFKSLANKFSQIVTKFLKVLKSSNLVQ